MTITTHPRPSSIPEGLTRDEFDRLQAPDSIGDPRSEVYRRDRMLIDLLSATGLRISEALTLTRDRVDVVGCSLWLPAGLTKSKRARRVYFGESLAAKIQSYLADLPAGQNLLFATKDGTPLADSHVRRLFKKVARRAGIAPERLHPHALRHSYAVRFLGAGGSLEALRDQLGHSSIQTTAIYLQSASWHRAEQVAKLDL